MRQLCAGYALFTVAALWFSFFHPTTYGAGVSQNWLGPGIGVRYRVTGLSGPATTSGLTVGDVIRYDGLPVADRWHARYGARRGTPVVYAVERRGQTQFVRIPAQVPTTQPLGLYGILSLAVGTVAILLTGFVGYRRPGVAALALTTYAGGIINPNYICSGLDTLPDGLFIGVGSTIFALYNLFPNIALAVFVIRFPHLRTGRYNTWVTRFIDAAASVYFAVDLFQMLNLYGVFYTQRYAQLYLASSTLLVLLAAIYVYVNASFAERAKARLMLIAVTISSAFYTLTIVSFIANRSEQVLQAGSVLALGITAAALAYAIMKHHIFDIAFIVNTALAVALTSGILLVLFTMLEFFTENALTHVTQTQNMVLNAIIACLIVAAIAPVHRRADSFIDRALFRKRHESEVSLRNLAGDLRFRSSIPEVLDETITVLTRSLDVEGVAVYLQTGLALQCVRATVRGIGDVPLDDPAMQQLSSRFGAMDLARHATSFYGFRAYPMVLGGRVIGVLTIGARHSHETIAPDIDRAIDAVAQAVGASTKAIQTGDVGMATSAV
jgi:hypothetical protein